MRASDAKNLSKKTLCMDWGDESSPYSLVQKSFKNPSLDSRIRVFLWFRVALVTALFLVTVLPSYRGVKNIIPSDIFTLAILLLFALCFGFLSANGLKLKLPTELIAIMQVGWDLVFSASWIYSTGGTGSLFLFLYLCVIIEASFLLDLHGIVLTAFLCALLYWAELHLEFHHVLRPVRPIVSAPIATKPDDYPISNVIFFVFAMMSTAWLASYLKQRFSKTRLLLQEKSENFQDLLHLNESIVRCVRSGLITLDEEDRVTSINQAASAITGYEKGDLTGTPVEEFLGDIPIEEVACQEEVSPFPFRWEQSFTKKDGRTLILGCSGAVLRDHKDESFGTLVIFQDLTYYKQIEGDLKRAERLAAIGGLAAGLAHEIRNPLASLYGSIQLLQGELELEESQQRLMKIILQESERLNGLITDFLQFASPHADQKESLPLRIMIDETLQLFQQGPDFHEGIHIAVDVEPSLSLYANRKQILQVLWNLLLNAAQSMPGGGEIRVKAEETQNGNGRPLLSLIVQDSGKGIPRENVGKIFDPFFTSRDEGTGLGLAVVYRIVDNHGGRIQVNSEVGQGTVFQVDLPGSREENKQEISCFATEGGVS